MCVNIVSLNDQNIKINGFLNPFPPISKKRHKRNLESSSQEKLLAAENKKYYNYN